MNISFISKAIAAPNRDHNYRVLRSTYCGVICIYNTLVNKL